jgi:hypothetical protein
MRTRVQFRAISGPRETARTARTGMFCLVRCGALGGTRTPNLLIRRFQCGRPDPSRSVRDLGLIFPGRPAASGSSEGCASVWLQAWLPSPAPRANALMVFKRIGGSWSIIVATCVVGTRGWPAGQDHPANIPRPVQMCPVGMPHELRITRVFSCVARGFKARPSFMFAGC